MPAMRKSSQAHMPRPFQLPAPTLVAAASTGLTVPPLADNEDARTAQS